MSTATDTHLLLRALCDEFGRCGMVHACTSPGSRNSPIVISLVGERRIHCWSHIDERCAGFFAVGAAKASGRPVAITCTSGTACANLAPAVIEAFHARVPLIVLTADRPAELRDVGAGQAIDQLKLYGDAVKWFVEVEQPDASPITIDGPWRGMVRVTDAGRPEPLPARGVIVAGRDEHGFAGLQAATTAAQLRYPLLADPLSAARHGDTAITAYDLLLRDLEFGDRLRPELVIRVGDLPTSKPLRAWLASLGDVPQLALDPEGAWQDPAAVVSEVHRGDPAQTLRTLALLGSMPDESWLADWTDADDAVTRALSGVLDRTPLSEPAVARLLGESLGPDVTLFCAASMPIRDLELYLPAGRRGPTVLSNRGANGIDGTVSSAFGVAATGRRVVLLIGDVALAHDIGGLLSARRLGLELTIVLLNNDGGGIFHFLPISNQTAAFKQHIATPHGLAFEHAAALYGLRYERPQTAADLCAGLRRSVGSGEASIIEIRTDRAENLTLHRRLAETGLDALAGQSARGVNGSADVSPPPRPPRLSRRAPAASRRA
jgi:2-succinyl-5-enolpyruvyl-6-hydroxy-3-cyclohexene-1-carboxylate synthase